MSTVLDTPGKWVKIRCSQCGKQFPYLRTSNVIRKFCTGCAETRTANSKRKFEEVKKTGLTRNPDEAEAQRRLKHIPDAVNWNQVLAAVAKGF